MSGFEGKCRDDKCEMQLVLATQIHNVKKKGNSNVQKGVFLQLYIKTQPHFGSTPQVNRLLTTPCVFSSLHFQ